jgi:hypothetical protein
VFFLSDGPVEYHANGSVCVRFNEEEVDIDAYKIDNYTSDVRFPYVANRTYIFHLSVDVPNQVFDLLVGTQLNQMVRVATAYPFRRPATRLDRWNIIHHNTATASGIMTVCDVTLGHPNPTTGALTSSTSSSTSTSGSTSSTSTTGAVSDCVITTTNWQAFPMTTQTSTFDIHFTASATTQTTNAAFFLSDGPVEYHANGSVCVRFNEEEVDIDAYHTNNYTSDVRFSYVANRTYIFHLSVDVPNQVFDLFVGTQLDQMVRVARRYPFRRPATRLDRCIMTVCDVTLGHPNPTTGVLSGTVTTPVGTSTGDPSTTGTQDIEISAASADGVPALLLFFFFFLALYF